MSGYTSAYLTCNGRDPSPDPKVPDRLCPARVEGGEHDGELIYPSTLAAARKLARKLGWSSVRWPYRSSHSPSLARDYCPAHQDQAQAQAEQWGVKLARPKPKQED